MGVVSLNASAAGSKDKRKANLVIVVVGNVGRGGQVETNQSGLARLVYVRAESGSRDECGVGS